MMRFEFVRVGPTNTVTGRVFAESIHEAARLMVTGPSEYLTSAASHAIGVPRAIKEAFAKRLCLVCVKPLGGADMGTTCGVCRARVSRKNARAKATGKRDAYDVGRPRGRHQPRPL